jgi:formate--tetrahydrofolate ligase
VIAGAANLRKQIENVVVHGVSPVVAINAFPGDHRSEHDAIRAVAEEMGVRVAVCNHFSEGGAGAVELADAVVEACEQPSAFRFLYPLESTLRHKIETIATTIYGASGVDYSSLAQRQLDAYERNGFGALPVCMAKTHLSISADPTLLGAPTGHVLPVREVRANAGAGFVYPICGEMRTMPGLGTHPAAAIIDLDDRGEIVGLS